MGMKLIYKKALMIELVKLGHDLEYTARNRANLKYQCYFFKHTKQLDKNLAMLTGKEHIPDERAEQ